MFKKKTQKEKEISKLESQLFKHKQKRDFLMPRVRNKLFSGDVKVESVSVDRERKIIEYDEEIMSLKQRIDDLKGDID